MKSFREIKAANLNPVELRDEMEAHGYALIRGLLSPQDLRPLLRDITQNLHSAGWLNRSGSAMERIANVAAACAEGDPLYKVTYEKVFSLQSFHTLPPHHPLLQRVMKLLVGEQLLIHPKSAARLIFPSSRILRGVSFTPTKTTLLWMETWRALQLGYRSMIAQQTRDHYESSMALIDSAYSLQTDGPAIFWKEPSKGAIGLVVKSMPAICYYFAG
jgi:hypothetical protein